VLGFQDETWWSRVTPPQGSAWAAEGRPLQVVGQSVPKGEKKAKSCFGLLTRCPGDSAWEEQMWLRFIAERPVGALTIQFLEWCCERAEQAGKRALLLIWDNAGWHISYEVRGWIRSHNWSVRQSGRGVRILACYLPSRSPWLNPIEPKWMHAKRAIAEPNALLSFEELERRVCAHFGCERETHLSLVEKAA
jgi:transposase